MCRGEGVGGNKRLQGPRTRGLGIRGRGFKVKDGSWDRGTGVGIRTGADINRRGLGIKGRGMKDKDGL